MSFVDDVFVDAPVVRDDGVKVYVYRDASGVEVGSFLEIVQAD